MDQSHVDLQYRFFMVGNRPFALWDFDIRARTLEFLNSIDPHYFEYVADAHLSVLKEPPEDDEQAPKHAATSLRLGYGQAMETFFGLLCALLQAPRCIPAWMALYRTSELHTLVDCIAQSKPFPSQLKWPRPSWNAVADFVLTWLVLEDKSKKEDIKKGLAQLWRRFASDFLDQGSSDEYNSIKHGLRIRPGGFHFAIGVEETPGTTAPPEKMQLLGKSDFGSSYFVPQSIGVRPWHLQLARHARNWAPEDFAWGLHLVSLSIANLVSAAKIINETPADDVRFHWPSDLSVLSEPWKRLPSVGITSIKGPTNTIPPELIEPFTRDQIRARYRAGEDAAVRRVKLRQPDGPPPSS